MLNVTERTPEIKVPQSGWPQHPYRGLNFFTIFDAPLFGERDIELSICDELINNLRTRMLLLHGRSGTGKSSFIRAGLLPRLVKHAAVVTLNAPDTSDGLVIRCTADPISQIILFLKTAVKRDRAVRRVPGNDLRTIARLLTLGTSEPRTAAAERLVEALSLLTPHLDRPLLLVIDQGEELLALPDYGVSARQGLFWLLEELCWRTKIGVKLLFVLRTEYYGQFCDYFRLEPQTKLASGYSGVEQFMLHGLRNVPSLASAISRPASTEKFGNLGAPRDAYAFEFAPGLPERIATDLVRHCGESSTLPVMQIVCTQLYEGIKQRGDYIIEENDYKDIGFVAGALDAFVDSRIEFSIREAKRTPDKLSVQAWRSVLGSLVAKQESGAVTTLIASRDRLVRSAADFGLTGSVGKIITNMARERCRLLRQIDNRGDTPFRKVREYSLGHDALAVALYRWAEAHEELAEEKRQARRRMRKLKFIAASVAFLVLVVTAFTAFQLVNERAVSSEMLRSFAELDQSGSYSQRLKLLNASIDQISGLSKLRLDGKKQLADLKAILQLSPVSAGEGDAVGLAPDGLRFALLRGDRVTVSSLGGSANTNGETPELKLIDQGQPIQAESAQTASNLPLVSAVGFISNVEAPVAYKNGSLFYWIDGQSYNTPLGKLLPEAFLNSTLPLGIEIVGGVIRVWPWRFGVVAQDYVLIYANKGVTPDNLLTAGPPLKLTWRSLLPPTSSPWSSRLVYLEPDKDANTFSVKQVDYWKPMDVEEIGKTRRAPATRSVAKDPPPLRDLTDGFVQSIAFVVDAPGVAVRSDKSTIEYFAPPSGPPLFFQIPAAMRSDPQRPFFFSLRPLLAAHKGEDKSWRFAWLAPDGINVMSSKPGDVIGKPVTTSPLLVGESGIDAARFLAFTVDGQYLIVGWQRGFREKMKYRLYDLSETRRKAISEMNRDAAQREACRVATFDQAQVPSPARSFLRHDCD